MIFSSPGVEIFPLPLRKSPAASFMFHFFPFLAGPGKACFQSFADSFHPICEGCTLYSLYRSIIGSSSPQVETLYPVSSQGMIPPLGKTAPHAGKIRKGLCHLPGSSLAASVRLIEKNTSCCLFPERIISRRQEPGGVLGRYLPVPFPAETFLRQLPPVADLLQGLSQS